MTKRVLISGVLLGLALSAGCYRVTSQLLETPEPPDDLYRCLQLELGRAGYAIVGADRASGWLHAQRRIDRWDKVVRAEIYATVISTDGSGSHLQFTENSYAEGDAAVVRERCAPGAAPGGPDPSVG